MPERTTQVNLVANVANYVSNMTLAEASTRKLGDTALATAVNQKAAAEKTGTAFLGIGVVAAAAVGIAVAEFAKFDAKMSELQGLSGASASQREQLTQAALHDGTALAFTASQVADAEIQLVKAGLTVEQTVAALPGVLRLAAAAGIDTATATDIAAQAMLAYNLNASEIPHVADLLVAASDKTLTSVTDLAAGINTVAPEAHAMGISLDDVVGTLSAFSAGGLKGTAGASALQQMLIKLTAPSATASAEMKSLGINMFDAQGNFIGITAAAGQLHDKLGPLTASQRAAAEATIFGARATKGANILYAEGAAGIDAWNKKVDENGAAATQAAAKLDNLDGDLGKLKAAFETDLIETGSGANDVLRDLVQGVTGLVGLIGDVPAPVLEAGLALGAIIAITALVTGGFLTGVPKIVAFKAAIDDLGISSRVAAIGVGSIALAATALVLILAAVAQANAQAAAETQTYEATLNATTHGVTQATREAVVAALTLQNSFLGFTSDSAADSAQKLGISLNLVTDAALGQQPAIDALNQKLDDLANKQSTLEATAQGDDTTINAINNVRQAYQGYSSAIQEAIKEAKQKASADKDSADSINKTAAAYNTAAQKAQDLNSQILQLIDNTNTLNKTNQTAISTNADYESALAAVQTTIANARKGIDGAVRSLNPNTAAGSANLEALSDLAEKSQAAAAAQYALDNNTQNYVATLQKGHNAIVAAAEALGDNVQQANDLADAIDAMPTKHEITLLLDSTQAVVPVDTLIARLQKVDTLATMFLTPAALKQAAIGNLTPAQRNALYPNSANGNMFAYANGGFSSGIYAGRPGGIQKFAEPETGWELYVSGKKSERARNQALLMEGAKRLGMTGGPDPIYYKGNGGMTGGPAPIQYNITVPVTIEHAMVGDETYLAQKVTSVVAKALRGGTVSQNWQVNG